MIIKRVFDLFCSVVGLIVLLPILVCIALGVKMDSPGPVLFRQIRVGRFGKPFRIYKFRTMIVDAESVAGKITGENDFRITRFGIILRKYKLDELPQLINVLNGDMSLVGPRPEVPVYVSMFEKDYREILAVKPGITDYAAIEFRHEENLLGKSTDVEKVYTTEVLPKKIVLYKKYLQKRGFMTDIKIILLTLLKIVKK